MAVAQTLNDSLYAIPLIPLTLALIFALTRRERNEAAGNRSYNALTWLAGLAIVFGLAFTFRWTAQEIGYYQQLPHLLIADGLFSGITTSIALDLMSGIGTVAMLLVGGATLLAIALAWADRRYGWLTALIAVAIMALLWPTAVDAWGLVNGPAVLLTATPSPVPASVMVAIFTAYAAPLVAVILALIFALTRHRPAPAVAPDGALGVAGSGQ